MLIKGYLYLLCFQSLVITLIILIVVCTLLKLHPLFTSVKSVAECSKACINMYALHSKMYQHAAPDRVYLFSASAALYFTSSWCFLCILFNIQWVSLSFSNTSTFEQFLLFYLCYIQSILKTSCFCFTIRAKTLIKSTRVIARAQEQIFCLFVKSSIVTLQFVFLVHSLYICAEKCVWT